jgi:hypothetical protein
MKKLYTDKPCVTGLTNFEKKFLLELLDDERMALVQHWNRQGHPSMGVVMAKEVNAIIHKLLLTTRDRTELEHNILNMERSAALKE